MTTPTTTYALGGGVTKLNFSQLGKQWAQKFTIDASNVNVANAAILKLMDIPTNVTIDDVIVNVRTAEGATQTCDIGDYLTADDSAVDADGFFDALDLNSAAVSKTSDQLKADTTTVGYAAGKYYSASTAYIGILFNHAADATIFDVIIKGTDCN